MDDCVSGGPGFVRSWGVENWKLGRERRLGPAFKFFVASQHTRLVRINDPVVRSLRI